MNNSQKDFVKFISIIFFIIMLVLLLLTSGYEIYGLLISLLGAIIFYILAYIDLGKEKD